ncbi:hypothetical protein V1477_015426 [Vespula maculifrons]|uniref:Uncharacterized protein n=1 Tax=Vespula maculifrons TaxID=7453 RepID=A0ABD2BFT2_VESMC
MGLLILPKRKGISNANLRVESPLARGSPDAATSTRWDLGRLGDRWTYHRGIFTRKHDRSCLEMFEADGVDSGAICKRGFIHLQFAEKPEAPEAERHLGSWILEVPVSPWVSTCSNLHAVGPGSEVLVFRQNLMGVLQFLSGGTHESGLMGVGFCAGLLSVPKNQAGFLYSGFHRFFRVGPLGWAFGRGLLCGSPFSTEKPSLILVL